VKKWDDTEYNQFHKKVCIRRDTLKLSSELGSEQMNFVSATVTEPSSGIVLTSSATLDRLEDEMGEAELHDYGDDVRHMSEKHSQYGANVNIAAGHYQTLQGGPLNVTIAMNDAEGNPVTIKQLEIQNPLLDTVSAAVVCGSPHSVCSSYELDEKCREKYSGTWDR
jgi:hypothetical protein